MAIDVKFHCEEKHNFKDNQSVRAFLYSDYSIEHHCHEFYEVNIIMGGSGVHQIEEASFSVSKGDVFVIPPAVAHSYRDCEKLDVYHILLQRSFIDKNHRESEHFPGFLQFIEIEPFLRQRACNEFLHLSQNNLLQLKTELNFIKEKGDYDKEEFAALKYHTTWKIIYWLSGLLFRQLHSKEKEKTNKYESAIVSVLEYIHLNYPEKITVEMLCEKAFLSRSTFLRSFSDVCGCSPIKYLNEYRRKKATEMMEQTTLSKTQIAHACGFYDLSHMERMNKNGI